MDITSAHAHGRSAATGALRQREGDTSACHRLGEVAAPGAAAMLAHEIRQPLMIIGACLRTLRSAELSADARAAIDDIDEELWRLSGIVAEILGVGGAGRRALVDLHTLARKAVRIATRQFHLSIALRVESAAPIVLANPDLLSAAIRNLLSNACQAVVHAAQGKPTQQQRTLNEDDTRSPAVTVELTRHDAHLRIAVRDRGAGIAPGVRERLFIPGATTRPGGLGLGLFISRRIIEALGGRVWLESCPAGGTLATIELPGVVTDAPLESAITRHVAEDSGREARY